MPKDNYCGADSPVIYGLTQAPIYGKGVRISPRVPGKQATPYERNSYLSELLPLEAYDIIIVLLSGGKDSIACLLKLLELGVPSEKIECWHHDVDGGHPTRRMDWPVTQSYIRALCTALGVKLRVSWRIGGFWGEVYRIGSSMPISYEDGDRVKLCPLSQKQLRSHELRAKILGEDTAEYEELKSYGYRMKFPAKTAGLERRWCSSALKITVADRVLCNLEKLQGIGERMKLPAKGSCAQGRWCSGTLKASVEQSVTADLNRTGKGVQILVVSGERRDESTARSHYNEVELHSTHAVKKAHRLVHHWRAVIDYSERDIWEILRRHAITPHPCYSAGWNRCSCMMCIFSKPCHFAGIRELFPKEYEQLRQDEIRLGFTLDNKRCLDDYVGDATSCVDWTAEKAIAQLKSGCFAPAEIHTPIQQWAFPAGAFRGAQGGPC